MTTADIAKLPVAEKLLLMERLWDALRVQADSSVVPAWHKDVLAERLSRLDAGDDSFRPGQRPRSAFARGSKQADVAQVRIARSAEVDLLEGCVFYEQQQAGVGDYFLYSLYADIDALALYAGIHPQHDGRLHRSLAGRFPFAIYYELKGDVGHPVAAPGCSKSGFYHGAPGMTAGASGSTLGRQVPAECRQVIEAHRVAHL